MDWPLLLASTARLLDLHDCDRGPGTTVYSPPDKRPGTGLGLWLKVATSLMQYLYERDLESNDAWVPVEVIFEELADRHNISREDILFVANYLATPTRLISIKAWDEHGAPERQTLKRETALIEWPRNTKRRDRCRLSTSGSRSVLLSQAAQKWLYAADDAGKLERAINYCAYGDIPSLSEGLVAQIRRFSKEITMLLERQHMDELMSDFEAHRDDYLEVIKGVQESVERAADYFGTKQNKEQYLCWLETEAGQSFTPYTVQQSFHEILQAIERLSRKFQTLVSALASAKREVIGLIRFDEAAVGLALHPCSDEITDLCITALGPWSADITAPSPMDFSGILSLQQESQSSATMVFEDEAVDDLPALIERFLHAYRDEILAELAKGPVSLTAGIENGWVELEEVDVLPQFIGVYSTPEWLDESNRDLGVSVGSGELDVLLPNGNRLQGDELILHWVNPTVNISEA
ncbi:hypothetical protein [Microbulbifer epialgicus]|uniref:Uncharacterized protein n=1 Tax=Microbulbifer epialgicus TaxID=393907 RepID=A0ABV4P5P3_9GAMM